MQDWCIIRIASASAQTCFSFLITQLALSPCVVRGESWQVTAGVIGIHGFRSARYNECGCIFCIYLQICFQSTFRLIYLNCHIVAATPETAITNSKVIFYNTPCVVFKVDSRNEDSRFCCCSAIWMFAVWLLYNSNNNEDLLDIWCTQLTARAQALSQYQWDFSQSWYWANFLWPFCKFLLTKLEENPAKIVNFSEFFFQGFSWVL